MRFERVVLLVAPDGEGGYEEITSTPRARNYFYLDREGLVAVFVVVAASIAGAAACLSFKSVSAVPLTSLSYSEQKSSSRSEGGTNLAVPIRTVTSCKFKHKQ